MAIDLRTIILITGVLNLIQILVFFFHYKGNKNIKGLGWWLMWSLLAMFGFILLLLRGIPILPRALIVFQNVSILSATLFIYIGALKFFGKKVNWLFIFYFIASFITLHLFFIFVKNDIHIRALVLNIYISIIAFVTALTFYQNKTRSIASAINFNFTVFVIHGCIFAYRTVMITLGSRIEDVFDMSLFNLSQYLDALIVGLLWTFGFIIMLNQKLNSDIIEAKTHFEEFFSASPDAVFITRFSDGLIVDINNNFTKIFGYKKEDVLGKSTLEINLFKNRIDRESLIKIIIENKVCDNYELQYKRKNGEEITGLTSVRIISLKGIPHLISVTRDISERKQIDKVLRENEEKYRDLANFLPQIVFEYDLKGNITFVNKHAYNILGYPEDLEIKNFNLLELLIPDDRPRALENIKRWTSGLSEENNEYTLVRFDGSLIKVMIYSNQILKNNIPIGFRGIVIDVTKIKEESEKLRESEEKYRYLFENNPQPMWIYDLETLAFIEVNEAVVNLYGYSKEEFLLMTIKDICPEEDLAALIKDINQTIRPLNFAGEWMHVKKNGNLIFVEITSHLIISNGRKACHVLVNDITERRLTERALNESEEKFRNLFETMPNGFYRSTPEGYFIDANPAFVEMLGYDSKEELLKAYIPTDIYVKPEERDVFARENEEFVNSLEIFRLKTKDGRIIWLEDNAKYIKDEEGKVIYNEGICRDITDRKQAEEKLRESEEKLSTLFGSMTEMVALHELVFNKEGEVINYRITDCNNSFTEVTGIQKTDAIGRLATDVYQIEAPPYLEEYTRVAQTGEPFDYTTYFAPLDKHFMISAVSPKKNHFATITTDITLIKQVQDAISAKKVELENYLFIASHDLRSPMVNIQGFSQRLQRQADKIKTILEGCMLEEEIRKNLIEITNEGLPKTINFILSNTNKMDSLINGLLQISRTGRIKMVIQKINMNLLCKNILANNNFQISEISAKVIVSDLPDCYGDENQLNQLFSNIIGNALKYRDNTKQLVINISGHMQYSKVTYSIKDNGIGIPQKYLEKIWDIFFRVDSNSSEAGEGIGLSLAKRITDKHNGKIWVESVEGEGSTFYVELQKNEFTE